MKLIMPTEENHEAAKLASHFGRAKYFAVYDSETDQVTIIPNPGADAQHGAGIQAARTVLDQKPDAVIAPRYGPKAEEVLSSARMKMYVATEPKTIRELYQDLQAGKLS